MHVLSMREFRPLYRVHLCLFVTVHVCGYLGGQAEVIGRPAKTTRSILTLHTKRLGVRFHFRWSVRRRPGPRRCRDRNKLDHTLPPPPGAVTPTAAPQRHMPRAPPMPSISPTQAEGLDDGVAHTSIAAASVVGSFLLVALVLTCAGLKSHCDEKRKSIRRSLEALFARGSFWGAMFVLFGLLIALNIYNYSSPWAAVIIFGTFVIWFGVVAWFVAFQTGTPATVSLDCPCRACRTACRVEDGSSSDAGSSSRSSSRGSSRSSSACSTPAVAVSPKRPCSSRGRGGIKTPQAAVARGAAPSPAAVRPAADSFFPETAVVRAVYFPSSTHTVFVPSTTAKAATATTA